LRHTRELVVKNKTQLVRTNKRAILLTEREVENAKPSSLENVNTSFIW
jgi:hypothetical protein